MGVGHYPDCSNAYHAGNFDVPVCCLIMLIFLFFIPGIFLVFFKAFIGKGPAELLTYIIGFSFSFFIVFPWLIKLFGIPLQGSICIVLILAGILLVLNHKKIPIRHFTVDKSEISIFLILTAVLLLRLAPLILQQVPAGAVMSIQSYAARLIYYNDGIPDTFAFPAGLPALCAIISLLSETPIHRSSLFVSCFAYALITLGLYILLLRFFNKNVSAFSSVAASFLTISPQKLIGSGDNATVLAVFLSLVAISLVFELKEGFSRLKLSFALLASAAVFIAQPLFFLDASILIVPISFIFALITKRFWAKVKRFSPVIVITGLSFYCFFYLYYSVSMCPVSKADIEAFKWIDRTISKQAIFMNNRGDAGLWIPAITGRMVTDFQGGSVKIVKAKADYIYIGSKAVSDIECKKEDLEKQPWKYKRVYSKDGAQVWKIL